MCESLLNAVLEVFGDPRGRSVLECGCGTGRVSIRLASMGAKVTLVDKSAAAIRLALELSRRARTEVEALEADLESLPFPDGCFDLVWNAGVLEHFPPATQVLFLREMARVCKPEGCVLVVVPYAGNPFYLMGKWWAEKRGTWPFGHERPLRSLGPVFDAAGVTLKAEYTIDFSDAIEFMGSLPGGDVLRQAAYFWYDSLDQEFRRALPGRWLVAVGSPSREECSSSPTVSAGPVVVVCEQGRNNKNAQRLAPPGESCVADCFPPVVCLGSIKWGDLWQRPQQVFSRLTQMGHRVVYVEPTMQDAAVAQLPASEPRLRALLNELVVRSVRREAPGLYTILPVRGLVQGHPPKQTDVLLQFLEALIDLGGMSNPVWWVLTPLWSNVVAQLPASAPVVYDCVDDHRYFRGASVQAVEEQEHWLLCRATLVLTTSRSLYRQKRDVAPTLLVPNGADVDRFSIPNPEPTDLQSIPHPRLGISGAIAEWVDVSLLEDLARRHPEWHFVIIGSIYTDVRSFLGFQNVHFLGRKTAHELPAYLQWLDVGLIPFRSDHPLVASANPIKLYEYLAAGLPVVSTRWEEILPFADVVRLADRDDFDAVIAQVLAHPREPERLRRRVLAYDWGAITRVCSAAIRFAEHHASGNHYDASLLVDEMTREGAEWLEGCNTVKAYCMAADGDIVAALDQLDVSCRLPPDEVCRLGLWLYNKGHTELARSLFDVAHSRFPNDPDVAYNLAFLLLQEDYDVSRAVKLLRELHDAHPDDGQVRAMLEGLALKRGEGGLGGLRSG
jgi:SAM-dependent methyltransferase/glycosyltransferase involved in cell wall biosynthesis